MFPQTIDLPPAECLRAEHWGIRLAHRAAFKRWQMRYKLEQHDSYDDNWCNHIEGAAGEIAASRALGIPWVPGIDDFTDPDLFYKGIPVQVRTRIAPRSEFMIIRQGDDMNELWVAVHGKIPSFVVQGWLWGSEIVARVPITINRWGRPERWVPFDILHKGEPTKDVVAIPERSPADRIDRGQLQLPDVSDR